MFEKFGIADTVKICEINADGSFGRVIAQTNKHPSIWQKFMKKIGRYDCLDDAMMNWGIQQIAQNVYSTYSHISVGTSSSSSTDYTLTDVVSQAFTRVVAIKSYKTTVVENDTVVFQGIFTPDSVTTIVETGLHTASTGGNMGARQTSCSITTVIDNPFGIIWEIAILRG